MNSKLSHVIASVYGSPWAILQDTLDAIEAVVQIHVRGERLAPEEVRERLGVAAAAAGPRTGGRVQGAVGVIPIYGVIMPRANLMSDISGGTSVQGITRAFRQAIKDDTISSILFDIDSPGGQVGGIEELASEIRAARGIKPMASLANYTMASAAYYLGAQADEVIASPSSLVGSIGCIYAHQETSRMDEQDGITTTVIAEPERKGGASGLLPLSEEALANLRQRVGDYYGQFVSAVAKGRGVTASAVRAGYGQGEVLTAQRAKGAGLVDRVDTFEGAIRRLSTGKIGTRAGMAAIEQSEAVTAEAELPEAPDETVRARAALALARAHTRR